MAALCRETYSIHKEVLQSSASFVMHFECALATPRIQALPFVLLAINFTWTRLPGAHPWYLGRILRRSFCGGSYLRSLRPRTNRGRRKPAAAWSTWQAPSPLLRTVEFQLRPTHPILLPPRPS